MANGIGSYTRIGGGNPPPIAFYPVTGFMAAMHSDSPCLALVLPQPVYFGF